MTGHPDVLAAPISPVTVHPHVIPTRPMNAMLDARRRRGNLYNDFTGRWRRRTHHDRRRCGRLNVLPMFGCPTVGSGVPPAVDPDGSGLWWSDPGAWNPDPVSFAPRIVTGHPDIAGAGSGNDDFSRAPGWCLAYDDRRRQPDSDVDTNIHPRKSGGGAKDEKAGE